MGSREEDLRGNCQDHGVVAERVRWVGGAIKKTDSWKLMVARNLLKDPLKKFTLLSSLPIAGRIASLPPKHSFMHLAKFHCTYTSIVVGKRGSFFWRLRRSMCFWKELHWKFNEVKCLWLPVPGQLLSSSLGAFPSFPEGTRPIPKLPKAYRRLHNPSAGCWSSSRAQLLGRRQGRQLCEPTGLAGPPRSSSQEGRSWSYSPPGYCRAWRGQAVKDPESTNHHPQYWTVQNRTFWSPSEWCHELRRFSMLIAGHGEEVKRWALGKRKA